MDENSTTQSTLLPPEHILQQDQIAVITGVYIAFLIPSVIGSFSVLLVSLLRWRNLQEQRQLLVQLALADFLASALLLSVTATNINGGDNSQLCQYGLSLALVFCILSFILAIIYAHKSKNIFRGWRTRSAEYEDLQSGGAWEKARYIVLWLIIGGIYLIYVLFIAQHDTSGSMKQKADSCRSCLLFSNVWNNYCPNKNFWHQEPIYIVLFFMAVEVFLFCTVIYHGVSKWYQGQQQHQQGLFPVEGDGQSRKRFKHVKHTASKMVLVIIFCWTPALLLFVLTFNIPQDRLYPLYIIQAATVSLQGFLNSMVYAWKRPNFTEAVLGERTPLITYHQAAFFEESLKTSV